MASIYDTPLQTQVMPMPDPFVPDLSGMESALAIQQDRADKADTFSSELTGNLDLINTRPTEGGAADRAYINELTQRYNQKVDEYMAGLEGKWDADTFELQQIANKVLRPERHKIDAIKTNYENWLAFDKLDKQLTAKGAKLAFSGSNDLVQKATLGEDGSFNIYGTDKIEERLDWHKTAKGFFENIQEDEFFRTYYNPVTDGPAGAWWNKQQRRIKTNGYTTINGEKVTGDKIQQVIDRQLDLYTQTKAGNQHYRWELDQALQNLTEQNPYATEDELRATAEQHARARVKDMFESVGQTFRTRSEHVDNAMFDTAPKTGRTSSGSKRKTGTEEGSYEIKNDGIIVPRTGQTVAASHTGLGYKSLDEHDQLMHSMTKEYNPKQARYVKHGVHHAL